MQSLIREFERTPYLIRDCCRLAHSQLLPEKTALQKYKLLALSSYQYGPGWYK